TLASTALLTTTPPLSHQTLASGLGGHQTRPPAATLASTFDRAPRLLPNEPMAQQRPAMGSSRCQIRPWRLGAASTAAAAMGPGEPPLRAAPIPSPRATPVPTRCSTAATPTAMRI
ncbi:unnamed protein product, partial [Urochloa humidicola]